MGRECFGQVTDDEFCVKWCPEALACLRHKKRILDGCLPNDVAVQKILLRFKIEGTNEESGRV